VNAGFAFVSPGCRTERSGRRFTKRLARLIEHRLPRLPTTVMCLSTPGAWLERVTTPSGRSDSGQAKVTTSHHRAYLSGVWLQAAAEQAVVLGEAQGSLRRSGRHGVRSRWNWASPRLGGFGVSTGVLLRCLITTSPSAAWRAEHKLHGQTAQKAGFFPLSRDERSSVCPSLPCVR